MSWKPYHQVFCVSGVTDRLTLTDLLHFEGQSGSLVVVLSRYDPQVSCYGPRDHAKAAAQDLLSLIPISWTHQKFGPVGELGVEVTVPIKIVGPETPCEYSTWPLAMIKDCRSISPRDNGH